MRFRFVIATLAALALLVPAASAQRGRSDGRRSDGPDRRDWTRTAVRTPEGGFRVGDPQARVQLVEYLSLTCPHCAAFAHEGGERLLQYVRNGQVSLEYRNYYLNGVDIAAALLSRCARPREYFDMTHELLGTQPRWMGRISALTAEQRAELGTLPPLEVARRLIALLGLEQVGARYGITPQVRQACLTQANLDALEQLRLTASQQGVTGTPAFFVGGRLVQVNTWAEIEPLLRAR